MPQHGQVDYDFCQRCGTCADLCPFGARTLGDRLELGECYGCGLCAEHCPHGAAQTVQRSYGRQREARPMQPMLND